MQDLAEQKVCAVRALTKIETQMQELPFPKISCPEALNRGDISMLLCEFRNHFYLTFPL